MPVIKSAKKKLKQDKKREKRNDFYRVSLQKALKDVEKAPSLPKISQVVKLIDKLAKKNLLHKNKAGRLKSKLSKLVKPKTPAKKPLKTAKK